MKRFSRVMIGAVMAVALCACGKEAAEQSSGVTMEPVESAEKVSETADTVLATPVVKDGVMRPGEDSIEVYFEWDPVEGADGYEVSSRNKFYEEESFREPEETVEVTDTSFVTGAQDYFDFLIKVRAFKGSGDSRVYSEWSEEAAGFTYTDDEIASDGGATTFSSYDDLIAVISNGLKNGFTEDEQFSLDISSRFFMNDPEFEILGYMKKDLDGDGTEELIFGENAADGSGPSEGWDSIIYDIFAMKDGKVVHVLDGWERNRYYLCSDGTIANEGSGGAAYSSWAYYKYADGKINIVETIFTDEDENGQGHWYYSDKEPYEDESNEVTEDEAMKTVNKYTYQKLEFTPFN